MWQRVGGSQGWHLRKVHYRIVKRLQSPTKHDGTPYQNTDECSNYLEDAGKAARYLDLVPAHVFVDRRNPTPHLINNKESNGELAYEIEECTWELPNIPTDLSGDIDLDLPGVQVYGYDYTVTDQPYHLELWIEKSTEEEILLPLCRRLGINLVVGKGFLSMTAVVNLLLRVAERRKPARIFYISDFDPAGDSMPVAVARPLCRRGRDQVGAIGCHQGTGD